MWSKAQTKPTIRDVFEITNDSVKKITEHEHTYDCGTGLIHFNAFQPPQIGDWIIRESAIDIYLCPKDVFEKKYDLIK